MIKGAQFSPCGKYRYTLFRFWGQNPKVLCIGLNPSTANAQQNDNTINTLIRVLKKLGYGGFYMMNLFAWISPNPDDLLKVDDPQGFNNNRLKAFTERGLEVIFYWGNFKQAEARIKEVAPLFENAKCFGHNQNGTPYHPRALIYRKGALDNPKLIPYTK